MTDKIIVPTADAVITPLLEKLYEKDPSSFQHLNLRTGVYWHPVAAFRAQATLMLKRVAALCAARRLSSATGKELLDYVDSEFLQAPDVRDTYAEGTIVLGRADINDTSLPGGDYPKGTIISRGKYTALGVTFESAAYETLADAHVDTGSSSSIAIPIRAKTTGIAANAPKILGVDPTQKISIPSLVGNMKVIDFEVGGGSTGDDDEYVRRFARASARGEDGPTADASKYGALKANGVRRFLISDHPFAGVQSIQIADASWGSSRRWSAIVQKSLYSAGLVGFGCKVSVAPVNNRSIVVHATVSLRDGSYLVETTDIDIAVRKATTAYFDEREDWNVWNESALRAAISLAHPNILVCTSAKAFDTGTGEPIAEILTPSSSNAIHLLLASNAMQVTFTGPS